MKKLILFYLLIPSLVFAAPPTRTQVYSTGEIIKSSEVTENEDNIFNYLQSGVDTYADTSIVNADISTTANIQSDKLNLTSVAQGVSITAAGSFTNAGSSTFTGNSTFAGTTIADLGTVTTADVNGGTMDNVQVDGATATGMLFVNDASDDLSQLGAQGTSGQFLQSAGAGSNPIWAADNNNSNVIFVWAGNDGGSATNQGVLTEESSLTSTPSGKNYMYLAMRGVDTDYTTLLVSRWVKIDGVDTITVQARIWESSTAFGANASLRVDVGGETATLTRASTSPGWATKQTIDVSGLTDGTTYNISVDLANTSGSANNSYLSTIVLLGS